MVAITCVKCGKEAKRRTKRAKYCFNCLHKNNLECHRNNYAKHREDRLLYQADYAAAHGRPSRQPGVNVQYRFIKKELRRILYECDFYNQEPIWEYDDPFVSTYLGSFLSLDPCGKYHHILSPNNITRTCEKFWENLNRAAEELGGWIESGEGDPLDTYYCFPKDVYDRKIRNHNQYKRSSSYARRHPDGR